MPETYAKTTKDAMANKLRTGKVERLEYFGTTSANTAAEIFVEGKSAQAIRLYIPLNTTVVVQLIGTARDNAGTPNSDAFTGTYRISRAASGAAVLTSAAVPLVSAADGTTAYTKLVAAVANTDEVRFTYTGAAASGRNFVRFRLNVVSVSTEADTLAI
jgi:hypothetical protein